MASIKQRKAIERLVENRGNVSRSMLEAGYAPASAKNPKNLTTSKGFNELLEEYGLTDELILASLVEDIKKKPQNRKPELELAAEIKGWKKRETPMTVFIPIKIEIKKDERREDRNITPSETV